MQEAKEDYQRLTKVSRLIADDAFNPNWSSDGSKIIYNRGSSWASGIEIIDIPRIRKMIEIAMYLIPHNPCNLVTLQP